MKFLSALHENVSTLYNYEIKGDPFRFWFPRSPNGARKEHTRMGRG